MPLEQRHDTSNGSLPYLFSPVSANANKPATLVLFLHGGRDRGTDLNVLLKWGLPRFVDLSDSAILIMKMIINILNVKLTDRTWDC
ncbi:hypothetical protein [Nostoc sp.]|uniref:hypothetical protein n=1 Tax=Nostoc sp. TaxID=1180 RepID=UPI002FFC0E25